MNPATSDPIPVQPLTETNHELPNRSAEPAASNAANGGAEIRKLNTLRGIAALIVAVSHYSNATGLFDGALGGGAGQIGVMIFFVLSGFLMSYLYLDRPFDKTNVAAFGIARAARVVPLYLVVVFVSYFLARFGVHGLFYDINNIGALLSHLFLLSGTSVLWTIPTEIQFYFSFVALWWIFSKRPAFLYAFASVVFAFFVLFEIPHFKGGLAGLSIDLRLLRSLPYFLVGTLLGHLYSSWTVPARFRKNIFIIVVLVLPLLFPNVFTSLTGHRHKMWREVWVFAVISLTFFSLVFLVPDTNRLLSNRAGDFLGKISYSLYLLHLPILKLIEPYANAHPPAFVLVFVALALATAAVSYHLLENPARRAIRSLCRRGVE